MTTTETPLRTLRTFETGDRAYMLQHLEEVHGYDLDDQKVGDAWLREADTSDIISYHEGDHAPENEPQDHTHIPLICTHCYEPSADHKVGPCRLPENAYINDVHVIVSWYQGLPVVTIDTTGNQPIPHGDDGCPRMTVEVNDGTVYEHPMDKDPQTLPAPDPIDVVDYCGEACENAVTMWVDGHCGCCGREWGSEEGTCRGHHVRGQVWFDLLDAQNTTTTATPGQEALHG